MHHAEHAVTVNAPIDTVWAVLLDVARYADIFPPTQQVDLLEESDTHQIVRLVVDVNGDLASWTSRRDINTDDHIISYRQLDTAPIVGSMGGQWRAFPLPGDATQLVLTHDFRIRTPVNGRVAERFTAEEADELLRSVVERNSVADLAAVKTDAERVASTKLPVAS